MDRLLELALRAALAGGEEVMRVYADPFEVAQKEDRTPVTEADLASVAARHVARFKLPKAYVFVDEVVRAPSGKADYLWARQAALGEVGATSSPAGASFRDTREMRQPSC